MCDSVRLLYLLTLLTYEILTRYGPERSRENEKIARAILDGLRLHYFGKRKGGANNANPSTSRFTQHPSRDTSS